MTDINTLIKTLHERGIRIWREDDTLRYSAPKGALDDELRESLTANKARILALIERNTPAPALHASSEESAGNGTHPAAYPQERRWIWYQFSPNDTGYSLRLAFRFDGPLNVSALEQSLRHIVQRHEPLRTAIVTIDGQARQIVSPPNLPLERVDLSALPATELEQTLRELYNKAGSRPFRLEESPLFRLVLVRLNSDAHALIMVVDHGIFDGWSLEIFRRELTHCYEAYSKNQEPMLPPVHLPYREFAARQRAFVNTPAAKQQLDYWKQVYSTKPPRLDLPRDSVSHVENTKRDDTINFALSAELIGELQQLAKDNGATLFMLLLAAYGVLLYRVCGQDDMVVGVPVAGRGFAGGDESIGCFVNVLPLRLDLSGTPPFLDLLRRVRDVVLAGFEHQDIPLEVLVRELGASRSVDATPLFQTMFNLLNVPATSVGSSAVGTSGVQIGPLFDTYESTVFDLELTLRLIGDNLHGVLAFQSERYARERISHVVECYCELLRSVAAKPDEDIARLGILTPSQRHWLNQVCEGPVLANPERTVPMLIREMAKANPSRVAIRAESHTLTYAELDRMANGFAAFVADHAERGAVVAILAPRSPMFLAAMLGIMRAGAAFLPLDPSHPLQRNLDIVAESRACILLSDDELADMIARDRAQPPISPHSMNQVLLAWSEAPDCDDMSELDGVAYVLYTSGSTGKPKGAMIVHRGLLNHTMAKLDDLQMQSDDVLAQTASQSFDIFVWQMLTPLAKGGIVHIYPDDIVRDPVRFVRALQDDAISIVEVVPSLLAAILDEVRIGESAGIQWHALRWMIATGEALPPRLCSGWLSLFPNVRLMNAYGPTECSDDVTHHVVTLSSANQESRIPIGRPVRNTRIHVLDPLGQPVPPGMLGEIYIGGLGVGLGYLGDPKRTEAAFVADPFGANGAKLYKTGDVGRWRIDGTLEFLGRRDDQVKIRGQRIELDEIVHALSTCAGVHESFVMYEATEHGGRLLACMRSDPHAKPHTDEIRSTLRKRLPEHMIPSHFAFLPEFPRIASGKLDRRTMRDILTNTIRDEVKDGPMPSTVTERAVAALWEEVLEHSPIGLEDDFFSIGGNSIHAIRIAQRVRHRFGIELPLAELFSTPTVYGLAAYIDRASKADFSGGAHMTVAAMTAEAQLETDIRPIFGEEITVDLPAHVLLTGATGFLGAFLLVELLKRTRAIVYCLVRQDGRGIGDTVDTTSRLRERLQQYGEWNSTLESRIIVITGDLSKPRFGLSEEDYANLANRIDTVYHSAAVVNLLYAYRNLKAANVDGTREVLRFAATGKLKQVHHVSTLSMMSSLERQGQILREDDELDRVGSLIGGYAQSKWVAEKLVEQARKRGIPVAVYRPHRITGHSRTGVWNEDDMVCRLIQCCFEAKAVPDLEATIEFAPVDFVASAIVELSLKPNSLGKNFHLVNQSTARLSALVDMVKQLGYPLVPLPYIEWQQRMFKVASNPDSPSHVLMPMFSEQMTEHMLEIKAAIDDPEVLPEFDTFNTDAGLQGTGVACPDLSLSLLATYFNHMARNGMISPAAASA